MNISLDGGTFLTEMGLQSSLFGMGTPCQIDVKLAKVEGRKSATVKDRSGGTYKAPVFMVSNILVEESYDHLLTRLILGWRRC